MKVAFYGRVSTEEQAERGNIESQVDFAKKYFELYLKDAEIDYFLDDGISGTIPMKNRPHGSKLLQAIKDKTYSAIYSYRLDRLARSVKIVLDTYELLEENNIALVSMTEAFDTSTPTGKFFMTLLASIAALERDTILERTQLGKERAAKEGRWTSGQPPFGYRVGVDKKLEISESEAETVRLIFRLYLEGMRTVPIAEYLNARDIPTPTKSKRTKNTSTGKWQAGHVSIILRNTAYKGEYKTMQRSKKNKEGVVINTPPIISTEDFDKANVLLLKNADVARGSKKREYLLRGLIFCGHCGHAMIGNTGDSKSGRIYYRCSQKNNNGSGLTCDNKQVKAKPLEELVWKQIINFFKNPGEVVKQIQEKIKIEQKDTEPIQKELIEVQEAINEKKASRNRVISLISKGLITEEQAEQELFSISKEEESLNRRREELFTVVHNAQDNKNMATNIVLALDKYKHVIDQLEPVPEIVRLMVDKIYIYTEEKDGKRHSMAKIRYKFSQSKCGLELINSRNAKM